VSLWLFLEGGVRSDSVEAATGTSERDDDRDRRDHYEQRSGAGESQQARSGRQTRHCSATAARSWRPRTSSATTRHAAATSADAQH